MRKLVFILVLLFLFSCGESYLFRSVKSFNGSWEFTDTFTSEIKLDKDTDPSVNGVFTFTHTTDYPYENLYLRNSIIVGDSTRFQDVISYPLQDDLGMWRGKKKGDIFKIDLNLPESYPFPFDESFKFKVEQYTREDALEGVKDIEIKFQ